MEEKRVSRGLHTAPALPRRVSASLITVVLIMAACAPTPAQPAQETAGAPSSAAPAPHAGPKVLTIAEFVEWDYIVKYGFAIGRSPGPDRFYTFHNNLTIWSDQSEPLPRIAQKVPSLQDRDWKANLDGTMEVTWKLRPGVTWHDGTPLTSDDFVFGFEVIRDPRITLGDLSWQNDWRGITSVTNPDPSTLVVAWGQPYIYANSNDRAGVPPVPRHQVEPLYRSLDIGAFEAHPIWSDQLIGLGPYRLTRYERGSFVEGEAYDGYFLGRPRIDRVIFKFVGDPQVQVAQFLSGAVDVALAGARLKPNQLDAIRDAWGPGKGQVFADATHIRGLYLNLRLEGQPWVPEQAPYATDKRFRQAMLHALNRDQLSEIYNRGYTTPQQYMTYQDDPAYVLAERANVVKFPFDPRRAQQIFAELGWLKGADGLLRNSAGQIIPFPCCRVASNASESNQESLVWGQDFKDAGLDVVHPIPAVPPVGGAEQRRLATLGWAGAVAGYEPKLGYSQLTTVQIATEANRWVGSNNGGWSNVDYDTLVGLRARMLMPSERRQAEMRLLALMAEEAPVFPGYMNPLGIVARDGVIGFARPECTPAAKNCVANQVLNDATTWNIHTWDIRS